MPHSQRPEQSVTELLIEWRQGDEQALELLMPKVYAELGKIARGHLQGERAGQTLSATDLVHEAFLRLVDADIGWNDRAHFLAVCSRAMRRILVDRSRAKSRVKRGAGAERMSLQQVELTGVDSGTELLELDSALCQLEALDPRKAKVVELVYFGGLSYDEVAAVLEISRATAHRDLRLARAWLHDQMASVSGSPA